MLDSYPQIKCYSIFCAVTNSIIYLMYYSFVGMQDDSVVDLIALKNIVFNSLKQILMRGDLKCAVLSEEDKANLVV